MQVQGVYCLACLKFQYISNIIFNIGPFPVLITSQQKCSNTQMYRYVVNSLTFFLIATTRSFIYYLQFYEVYTIIQNYARFNLYLRASQLRLQPSNPPIILIIIILLCFPFIPYIYIISSPRWLRW